MSEQDNARPNSIKKWRKIKSQFEQLIKERTPGGVAPSYENVVNALADNWCMTAKRIEEILRMELDENTTDEL